MATRIEDYGLIGDRETAALVGRDGSIDWLCWPRFDGDAIFAALLGTAENGRWIVAPAHPPAEVRRRYVDGTLVLETEFRMSDGGVAVLTDFMPEPGKASDVVRIVTGQHGQVQFRMELTLRFGYGTTIPWVTRLADGAGLRAVTGPDKVVLRTPAPLRGEGLRTVADFTVEAGQRVPFVMAYTPSHLPDPAAVDAERSLAESVRRWRVWSGRCRPAGPWTEAVRRSAITLRALTYRRTGGIVAAATTSLPEAIGGVRNWDYRICWLRDATLTLLALLEAGYHEEAAAWRDWLLRAAMGSPSQIQVMYGLAGERRLSEWELDWLPGYEGSRPVRVGNAAHEQLQIDVFGEIADVLHQAHRRGIAIPPEAWALQRALTAHLEKIWTEPDSGIWEVRRPPRHFTYSKVMAWAAVDRAVRGIEAFGLDGPLDHWRALRRRIHADVCANGFDDRRGSFVQAYGSPELDASLLLLPAIGFLPPEDPRILGTIAAIESELVENGLVLRYRPERASDGLDGGEGTFLACSFWLADAYQMTGRREEAVALFERLLALRSELGLLSEEYDPRARRLLGNFPQAFSHTALMHTAYVLGAETVEDACRHGAPAQPDPTTGRRD